MTTFHLVLSIALHFNWPIHQLDVKNAFLHGFIVENIYMVQPLIEHKNLANGF